MASLTYVLLMKKYKKLYEDAQERLDSIEEETKFMLSENTEDRNVQFVLGRILDIISYKEDACGKCYETRWDEYEEDDEDVF